MLPFYVLLFSAQLNTGCLRKGTYAHGLSGTCCDHSAFFIASVVANSVAFATSIAACVIVIPIASESAMVIIFSSSILLLCFVLVSSQPFTSDTMSCYLPSMK